MRLTARIVAAYTSRNQIRSEVLMRLIENVYGVAAGTGEPVAQESPATKRRINKTICEFFILAPSGGSDYFVNVT